MGAVDDIHAVHVPSERRAFISSSYVESLYDVLVPVPCVVQPHMCIMATDLITPLELPLLAGYVWKYVMCHVFVGP